MAVKTITTETFASEVLQSNIPVLVDFYADWCGPCKMLSPILEELERENDDVTFFKINIDENEDIAEKYQVFSIPNVVLFKNGKPAARSVGFKPAEEMQAFIDNAM